MTGPEPGGGTVESREPGKTGEHGWTERAGFGTFRVKGDGRTEGEGGRARGEDAPPAEGIAVAQAPGGAAPEARGQRDPAGDEAKGGKGKKRRQNQNQKKTTTTSDGG